MTVVKKHVGQSAWLATSPGPSGHCLCGDHQFCAYEPCTCTKCDPAVHHSLAGQAPRINRIGDPLPWQVDAVQHAIDATVAVAPDAALPSAA